MTFEIKMSVFFSEDKPEESVANFVGIKVLQIYGINMCMKCRLYV